MQKIRPIVLSVAGFDPCGGAGILADVKTCEQHKVQGMAVVTADTLQTDKDFHRIRWSEIDEVSQSIQVMMQNYSVAVVKIGIVKNFIFLKNIVKSVLGQDSTVPIIWDPVLQSSTGFSFFTGVDWGFEQEVLDAVTLITPNNEEFETLKPLLASYKNAVLLKGGHRTDKKGMDKLYAGNQCIELYPNLAKIFPKHGSGCVLSAAIACNLAWGLTLEASCRKAKYYIEQFLMSNPTSLGYHYEK